MEKEEESVSTVPVMLFLLGFFFMFAGIVVLIVAALQGNVNASVALIVFIGPVPVVLGAGPHALLAILFALVLTIFGFVVFVWLRRTKG